MTRDEFFRYSNRIVSDNLVQREVDDSLNYELEQSGLADTPENRFLIKRVDEMQSRFEHCFDEADLDYDFRPLREFVREVAKHLIACESTLIFKYGWRY